MASGAQQLQNQQNLIEVKNLTKLFSRSAGAWGQNSGVIRAVDNLSFSIREGETLGLVGESGSGKSTTGRLILRLLEPTSGSCTFAGKAIFTLAPQELRHLRREMQIVFQDPYGAFNPRLTVGRIIGEALELRGLRDPKECDAEVCRLLELVQLPAEVRVRFPHEFSGGQRQRIGIARALAVQPRFLVADEPVSALDVSTQAEVVNLLLDLQERLRLTVLFISHDLSVVRVVSDRVAVLFAGSLMELTSTEALFQKPLHPYTQELLAAIPIPDPQQAHRGIQARTQALARQETETSTPTVGPSGCPYADRCPHAMEVCRSVRPGLVDFAPRLGATEPHWVACHWAEQQYSSPDRTDSAAEGRSGAVSERTRVQS